MSKRNKKYLYAADKHRARCAGCGKEGFTKEPFNKTMTLCETCFRRRARQVK